MMTISLKRLRFFAHHGLYEGERKTGNEFEVNMSVSFDTRTTIITRVQETIDYVTLARIVKEKMSSPQDLLETIAMRIAEKVHHDFPHVKRIEVSIDKLNPPIEQFTGQTGVT